ncbi:iron-containing alcohol dehydrogenase [candidate division CSSED10-310 bacterium]|uniref:Iron-containing alcohol dehydrogenase n=1 Tax=candidate division CSSED10-310 bacterium TaxID=2855610 RepID=A0ABV6YWK8_UNCC1
MEFEFATATRIIFGCGAVQKVGPLISERSKRVFLVTGRSEARVGPLLADLDRLGIAYVTDAVSQEPTIHMATASLQRARQAQCDLVIGFGGGSVIDTGKVIATLLTNQGQVLDYLEVIGRGKKITRPAAPYIAIPTTAGTGAEVTRNAVLGSPEHQVKVSMRSPFMLPEVAVVDPELTYSMPAAVTASTGLDALTQLMEAFVTPQANPLTDGICREGMHRAAFSLQRAFEEGSNARARQDMALASLFGGLALANAKLGAAHGFAGPLGGMFSAPHGVICALLLPLVMAANIRVLQTSAPDAPALRRYDDVARILTRNEAARAPDGIVWIQKLGRTLKIPTLSSYGVTTEDFPAIVAKAQKASSMKGNPVELSDQVLTEILHQAL